MLASVSIARAPTPRKWYVCASFAAGAGAVIGLVVGVLARQPEHAFGLRLLSPLSWSSRFWSLIVRSMCVMRSRTAVCLSGVTSFAGGFLFLP